MKQTGGFSMPENGASTLEAEYTPEEFARRAEITMDVLTPEEQQGLIEHAWAYATVRYEGREPEALLEQLTHLEAHYGIH
jgi:hypothetical protein